ARKVTSMRMDQLTVKAAEAVQAAQELAQSGGHADLELLHLLSALWSESAEGNIVVPILEKVGVQVDRLRQIIDRELSRRPKVSGGQTSLSNELQQEFDRAQKEADRLKDKYISSEHLLLGLLDVASSAKEVLSLAGVNRNSVLAAMKEIRGNQRVDTQNPEE